MGRPFSKSPLKSRARRGGTTRINIFDVARKAHEAATRTPLRRSKLRDDVPGTDRLTREPKLTFALAREFLKLLHAGIPKDKILRYFSPRHFEALNEKERVGWLNRWANSPLMARASADYNKHAWQDLDKDSRLQLALDKHMAELAYYLYTANYDTADASQFRKIVDSRTALMEYVKSSDGEPDTPFMRAMKDLLSGHRSDAESGPPKLGESIPAERVDSVDLN